MHVLNNLWCQHFATALGFDSFSLIYPGLGWWMVIDLLQKSRVHQVQVILKELNGRVILVKLVQIVITLLTTVMYVPNYSHTSLWLCNDNI